MSQAHAVQPQPQPQPRPRPQPRAPHLRARAPDRRSAFTAARQIAQSNQIELAVLVAMVVRFAPSPYNAGAFLILAAVALAGRTGTILALAGLWSIFSVNPELAEETVLGAGSRFLVIGAALLAAMFRATRHKVGETISVATASTAAVAGALLVHSALFSLFPTVSIFKAVLWAAAALTIVSTIRGMTEEELARVHRFLLLFFAVVLIGSLATMPLPQARHYNGVGLQGLLVHPQMFGVFCALAGAYYFGSAMASPKPSWLLLGMVVLSLQGVFESAARTGGFALLLACGAMVALTLVRSAAYFRKTLPGLFSGRLALLAGAALLAALVNSDVVQQTTEQFVRKNSGTEQATAAYDVSRGWIIRDMMDNIQQRPAQGIGLGIQSSTHLIEIEIDEATGLPISAPVEKGVMWIAIFEELGLILGTLIFGWVLWGTARSLNQGAAVATASIAYFFSNFAEATFFSPGALGMLGLIIFFLGAARGRTVTEPVPSGPPVHPAWAMQRPATAPAIHHP